jgi:hypothetical protein
MMHNPLETRCPAREWAGYRCLQSFGENPLTAISGDTAEPARADAHHNTPSLRWKIGQRAPVAAVDARRHRPAKRAGGGRGDRSRDNQQPVGLDLDAHDGQPTRSQRDSTTHHGGSLAVHQRWPASSEQRFASDRWMFCRLLV